MSACVKSRPSPPALPKADSRRSKRPNPLVYLQWSKATDLNSETERCRNTVEEQPNSSRVRLWKSFMPQDYSQSKISKQTGLFKDKRKSVNDWKNSASEPPDVKARSPANEGVQMPALSLQNGQNDFIPVELLSNLTSSFCPQGRSQEPKSHKHTKVCGMRAPDAVWHYAPGRQKYQYFFDQPTSLSGAGRDISFLCDALAAQRQRNFLPPMPDRTTNSSVDVEKGTNSTQTLIPEEYHILTNKGVKPLQCYDDKFTVLLEDEQKRLKIFPSMRPSGRLEAVQLMRVMDDMLEKAGANTEFEEVKDLSQIQGLLELVKVEQNVYNIVFHELIRQVSVECIERGRLLAKLRQRYVDLLDRIPRQLISLHTETLAQRALDRRLTEEIICFKHSIAQLNEELNQLKEHDEQVSKQAEKAQEELSKALKQSQLDSDTVGEYHSLYELQRQRLERQIVVLTEERDLWSKVTYSIALKVINVNNLQLVSRLHVSEQVWSKAAEHFTNLLTAQDSEDMKRLTHLTDQWKERLSAFMENLRATDRNQYDAIRSVQRGVVRWREFCDSNIRNPDVKFPNLSEEELLHDLSQWSMVLSVQCERYGGEGLLSGEETLRTLGQIQDSWVEVCVEMFKRHPGLDGEAPKGQAAVRELSHEIAELLRQLAVRINGESGIHQQMISLAGAIDTWSMRLRSLIGRLEKLHLSDWSKLEKALGSWINLCEEALGNVDNTQTESERMKRTLDAKIEPDDVINTLREFVSTQNHFFAYTNLALCEEVSSMHALCTRWMVDLLILMVPDQRDSQEPSRPPSPELNTFKDVSFQTLEEDARNLTQKLKYLSKYMTSSCQDIVGEMMQKNVTTEDRTDELYQLQKLQRECAEWVDVCHILLHDLPGRPTELQLTERAEPKAIPDPSVELESSQEVVEPEQPTGAGADGKTGDCYKTSLQEHPAEAEETEATDDEKSGSVLEFIGHDGHIKERILAEESVEVTGHADLVTRRPRTENAQQAFNALATVGFLQQELLAVEARATSAEERALKAEEALQAALEKICDLENQQLRDNKQQQQPSISPEPEAKEADPDPPEGNQKPTPNPKSHKSNKKR